jgi:hypothetical protein
VNEKSRSLRSARLQTLGRDRLGRRPRHQPEPRDQRGREDHNDHARVLHHGHQARIGAKGTTHGQHARGGARQRAQSSGLAVEVGDPGKQEPGRQAQEQGAADHEAHGEPVRGEQGEDRGPEGGRENAAHDSQRYHPPPARHPRVFWRRERPRDRDEHRPDQPRRRNARDLC